MCDTRITVPWKGGKIGVVFCGSKAPLTGEVVTCKVCQAEEQRKTNAEVQLRVDRLMRAEPKARYDYLARNGWIRKEILVGTSHLTIIWTPAVEILRQLYPSATTPMDFKQSRAIKAQVWLDVTSGVWEQSSIAAVLATAA